MAITRAGSATRRRTDRRGRGDDGAVLVEFALALPLLLMIIVGMFSGGLLYNQKQQLTHATREGARYAATIPENQTFTNGGTWQDNVRDLIVERSVGDLTNAQVCVSLVRGSGGTLTVVNSHSTAGATTPCIPNQTYPVSSSDTGLRVQVTASRPGSIDLALFGKINVTLDAKATAKSETTVT
jgi:Flp pilus assembly protein TadG